MTNKTTNPFQVGDVIAFRFPKKEGGSGKARPCLIIEVDDAEIVVAYGSTSATDANRGLEVRITRRPRDYGLHQPTRFVCARRIRTRFDDPRVVVGGDGNRVIGHLGDDVTDRIMELRAIIEAEMPRETRIEQERMGMHPKRRSKGYLRRKPSSPKDAQTGSTVAFAVETRRGKRLAARPVSTRS